MFQVLVPRVDELDLAAFLASARRQCVPVFVPERIALLESLSQRILRHPRLRRDPAGAALGFWLRRAHLLELQQDFERERRPDSRHVPAGLVLHIAPANVDTMFVFSWALSFLAGNANIVRLTSRTSPLMQEVVDVLTEVFAGAPQQAKGNVFVTFGHDDAISARLSAACDTRIIWGGDETVARLRAVPLNPHATERAFASKRSFSVFDTQAYLATDAGERDGIASRMAADLGPFAQFACSSPHRLYWLGAVEMGVAARTDFGGRLEAAMAARADAPDLGWATRRITHAFALAAAGEAEGFEHRPHTTTVASSPAEPAELCGAGLLMHSTVGDLRGLGEYLRIDHQTITYFGLDAAQRDELAGMAGRAGVDRIVPVGRALDFGPHWDGFNLWADLTRLVVVQ